MAEQERPAAGFEEPLLPMHVPDPPAETTRLSKVKAAARPARESVAEDDKAARAAIPSWDDILLGVRRKRD